MSPLPSHENDEEQLIEIRSDGEVRFTFENAKGKDRISTRIPEEDAQYIFAAFKTVFSDYEKDKTPSVTGYWKVRLLAENDEVFFYTGADGRDFVYDSKPLSDILREKTGIKDLFALNAKVDTKSKIASIDIAFEQTAPDEVKEKYANEYGIKVEDTTERLIISATEGSITYNRRIANRGRTSLRYELREEVAALLDKFDGAEPLEMPLGNPSVAVPDDIQKTYTITVTYDDGDTTVRTGTFDKCGVPRNWEDFINALKDFFQNESLGILFDESAYNKRLRLGWDLTYCSVEIDGVVGRRYYLCDDVICVGDCVVVPAPTKRKPAVGKVVEVRTSMKVALPDEIKKAKPIIRKVLPDEMPV